MSGLIRSYPGWSLRTLRPTKKREAGNWSDDTLARAIREGIGHDGRALFTRMPLSELSRDVG